VNQSISSRFHENSKAASTTGIHQGGRSARHQTSFDPHLHPF
jgi:hypothetical protein